MKRALTLAAAIVVAAVPATSSAGTSVRDGEAASRGGQDLSITFTLRTVNGKPTQIRKYRFQNLTAPCTQGGPVDVKGRIGRMKINDAGKFSGKVEEGGGKVAVEGNVKNGGAKVEGTIRAQGKFDPASGCDSGKVKWEVS